MLEGQETLGDDLGGISFSVTLSVLDERILTVEYLTARAVLHDEVEEVSVFVGLKVLGDVGVIDLVEHLNLVHDTLEILIAEL